MVYVHYTDRIFLEVEWRNRRISSNRILEIYRVRVANELGAGDGKGARFATIVSVLQSTIIGLIFAILVMIFRVPLTKIFTSSPEILQATEKLTYLLAFTILLNSVQPVLSGIRNTTVCFIDKWNTDQSTYRFNICLIYEGVAVGSGWQSKVAYVNLACYYLIGIPLGVVLGWVFHLGVEVQF